MNRKQPPRSQYTNNTTAFILSFLGNFSIQPQKKEKGGRKEKGSCLLTEIFPVLDSPNFKAFADDF
jgi:hypothetical protein